MSYEGTIACGILIAIAFYQIGKHIEGRRHRKLHAEIQRISEKYRPERDR